MKKFFKWLTNLKSSNIITVIISIAGIFVALVVMFGIGATVLFQILNQQSEIIKGLSSDIDIVSRKNTSLKTENETIKKDNEKYLEIKNVLSGQCYNLGTSTFKCLINSGDSKTFDNGSVITVTKYLKNEQMPKLGVPIPKSDNDFELAIDDALYISLFNNNDDFKNIDKYRSTIILKNDKRHSAEVVYQLATQNIRYIFFANNFNSENPIEISVIKITENN